MDLEQYVTEMGDALMSLTAKVEALTNVVDTLTTEGLTVEEARVALKLAFPGSVAKPPEPVTRKPTVYEFFQALYNIAEGKSVLYALPDKTTVTFTMAVTAAQNVALPNSYPCGLLKIEHPEIAGGCAYVGMRYFWISVGLKYDFFGHLMTTYTDDPDVGGTWRNAYTKRPDGWYHVAHTARRFNENSATGLRVEDQVAADGTVYSVKCPVGMQFIGGIYTVLPPSLLKG